MNERKEDQKQQTIQQKRVCDFCGESVALLYCRADAAKLCLSCDCKVHSTNQLFTKHTRSLLCDACHSSPASIYCSTDVSVHCQNCDWERHKLSLSTLHDRRPLEGFTGCPSVTEMLAIIGFEDVDEKALFDADDELLEFGDFGSLCAIDGFSDLLVWDTPSFVRLDDLIPSSNSVHSFQAMGVPPLPKNRNAAFGQQKEEILSQLRRMAALEPNFDNGEEGIEDLIRFQDLVPERNIQLKDTCTGFQNESDPVSVPLYDANALQWCNDSVKIADQSFPSTLLRFETIHVGPDKDSDFGHSSSYANPDHAGKSCHPVNSKTLQTLPKVVSCELTSQERDSAISRYKEKKKNRRYDKHIRYESRKVRAERRIRIRGRFAKMDHKNTGLW